MKFVRLLLIPLALLIVGSVRLLARCGVLIRFGEFWSERIGHLAGNTECYLCEKDAGLHPKSFDIWTHRNKVSNKQLAKMIGREILVDPTRFTRLLILVNRMFRGWEKHVCNSEQLDRDIHNLFEKQGPHLEFTEAEERLGRKTLAEWGIPENAKWVCLIVRDSAYLPDLTYHGYRDSDIDTYPLVAEELVKRGYYVFRMGAKVAKRAESRWIIDYATNGMRSEFMDVYLGAKCEFAISNGTGIDAIPVIFRRPVCYVNYVPIEYLSTFNKRSLAIWKHHYKDGKRMSLKEIYESGAGQFMSSEKFTEAGITLVDNTPEEIRDVVGEMEVRCGGYPFYDDWEYIRQREFWKLFPRSMSAYNAKPLHGEIRMRIGAKFLEQYDQR